MIYITDARNIYSMNCWRNNLFFIYSEILRDELVVLIAVSETSTHNSPSGTLNREDIRGTPAASLCLGHKVDNSQVSSIFETRKQ